MLLVTTRIFEGILFFSNNVDWMLSDYGIREAKD